MGRRAEGTGRTGRVCWYLVSATDPPWGGGSEKAKSDPRRLSGGRYGQ